MSSYLKESYQSLEAYTPGEQPRDMQYIKLNTNESPYPPAPEVCAVIDGGECALLRLYSDPTCKTFKEKLASLYEVAPENIFVCNGSDDLLNFAFMAYGHQGAAFADITYGFYSVFAQLHGIDCQIIPLREDFTLDYQDYCGLHKLIVIANPNAPTGTEIPVAQIERILQTNPDSVVVIDEAYVDFGGTSCYRLIDRYDNLLVVRTFSKSRSMAGARLGCGIASPALIADLNTIKYSTNPYNVNSMTMAAGLGVLADEEYTQKNCRAIIENRAYITGELEKLGFTVTPSTTNFVFAAHPRMAGGEVYRRLRENGILVRHFDNPRITAYNRITVGTRADMETLAATLRKILEEDL